MKPGSESPSFESQSDDYSPKELSLGRKIFSRECRFALSVLSEEQLESVDFFPEIAFAGRSNVGKSSLINALTQQKLLARTSSTPGRTQCLNFFNIDNVLTLVDLPGYGFAKASPQARQQWGELLNYYLRMRPQLKRMFLLVDARVPLKKSDCAFMDLCDRWAISFQLVMTKCDGIKESQRSQKFKALKDVAKKHVACVPWISQTSSKKGMGLDALRAECVKLALGKIKWEREIAQ